MRVITVNVNGIRAAAKKGFYEWMQGQSADVICLQEVKAQEQDLSELMLSPAGYRGYFHFAEKKGYSGVAIYSRQEPNTVIRGLGFPVADQEGRYVAVQLGQLWVASLYLPSGTSGEERQAVKYHFLDHYSAYLQQLHASSQPHIICGDWNMAHKQIDLKNWKGNQKNSGFLPAERAWMDSLFTQWGYVDAFRLINQEPEQYTWWSHRGRAWEKNVGWRIDYQVVSQQLGSTVRAANIYKDQRFSDHAPLIVDYELAHTSV